MTAALASFDKYAAYANAVQSPREDARFLQSVYRELNRTEAKVLREDFCGTFALCCEWVKIDDSKRAVGLDIDPEPIAYGRERYLAELTDWEQARLTTYERNVLQRTTIKSDIICAFNFSYFCFHSRETLLTYFKACRQSLNKNGLLVVDTFGGSQCGEPSVETKRLPGLTYYFEQERFDPINNTTRFSIHFKPKGSRIRKRAFVYDWRMWSIPEIRDTMIDAGFRDVQVYWEGTARDGSGSGRFSRKTKGEPCHVWVAYVVGRA